MLIIQPGFIDIGWPALSPLDAATLLAPAYLAVPKALSRIIGPIAMQASPDSQD